jgi:hypothetical protein
LDDALAALSERQQVLDRLERRLERREKKVSRAERVVAQTTFGDGIWQVGEDFPAGTYRAPGGGGCYWALLGSADTSDIINNGGFAPNQTLTIDSPWFESSNCGTWRPI